MKNFNFLQFFKPRREFKEKTKNLYLSTFDQKYRFAAKPATSFRFNYALRGATVFAVLLILVTGTSAYAYETNVGADNILYPLKRYNETVRSYFVPQAEKPAFHLKLAERRLAEIQQLQTENPTETGKALKIAEDLKEEIKKSFSLPPQAAASAEKPTLTSTPQEKPQESNRHPLISSQNQEPTSQAGQSAQSTALTIRVISPNGGEKIPTSPNNFAIRYKIANFPNGARLGIGMQFLRNGKYLGQLFPPGGTIYADPQYWGYSWAPGHYFPISEDYPLEKTLNMIGKTAEPGSGYAIRIILYQNGEEVSRDTSDKTFSIVSKQTLPTSKPSESAAPIEGQVSPKRETPEMTSPQLQLEPTPPKPQLMELKSKISSAPICEFIKKISQSGSPAIQEKITSDKEIIQKFNTNCNGIE